MKKVLILLVIITLTVPVFGLFGDGSINNPYFGKLIANTSIGPGPIYIGGPSDANWIKTNSFTLTIQPGTALMIADNVVFEVGGTGSIQAIGEQGSPITFTAWNNNWGHIRLYNNTTSSEFKHCIFERANPGNDPNASNGGAIRIEYSLVTIENCTFSGNSALLGGAIYAYRSSGLKILNSIFRNNSASEGGAIYFFTATSDIVGCTFEGNSATDQVGRGGAICIRDAPNNENFIDRCKIYSNSSIDRTGGIHFDTGSGGTVQNSLIYGNDSNVGGGVSMGGYVPSTEGTVSIVNCVIAENNPCDITFRTSNGYFVQNSVIWGSDRSVWYIADHGGGDPLATNLINCAVQGALDRTGAQMNIEGFFTNSFQLNELNEVIDGPNFFDPASNDPANNDYRIRMISPCRDKGVSTETLTAPETDILGFARVGNTDIGAYEVQYMQWNGTVDNVWGTSGNWSPNGPPVSGISNVIIPSGSDRYPTNQAGQDFEIGQFNDLLIEPGAQVTLKDLINNGTLNLKSDANGIASLLVLGDHSKAPAAVENIELYLTGGGTEELNNWPWHYISSPVAGTPVSAITGGEPDYDLAQFDESLSSTAPESWQRGWISYDGSSYYPGETRGTAFSTLELGKGYNYWPYQNETYTISGVINTSTDLGLTLSRTGDGAWSGYNLIGNPFTCGLNIQAMFDDSTWPTYIDETVWFTSNNQSYVYGNGVGVPVETPGSIPPMQGFFVRANNTLPVTIYLPWSREHNSTPRFKGDKALIPLIRLSIFANGKSEETVVRFDEKAKTGNDNEFDSPRFIVSQNSPSIYTTLNGTDYTINGLPFPESAVDIPVTVELLTAGNHLITAMEIQELGNYDITLTDKIADSAIDLRSNREYAFSASSGLIKDRFILTVTNKTTGIEVPLSGMDLFSIFEGFGMVNILPFVEGWNGKTGSVSLIDMTGKIIRKLENVEFATNSLIQIPSPGGKGILLVELKSGVMRYVGKVIIR